LTAERIAREEAVWLAGSAAMKTLAQAPLGHPRLLIAARPRID
jgi:hypothetical protein